MSKYNFKEVGVPTIVLLGITVVSGALLGIVQSVTAPAIEAATIASQNEAKQAVFAEASEYEAIADAPLSGTIVSVDKALDGSGATAGFVLNVQPSGFGGTIDMMVGVDAEGTVTGVRILSMSETPGLGAKASDEGDTSYNGMTFCGQYVGQGSDLAVTKDGGTIISITGSTITSRAITDGVNEATAWVSENGGAY